MGEHGVKRHRSALAFRVLLRKVDAGMAAARFFAHRGEHGYRERDDRRVGVRAVAFCERQQSGDRLAKGGVIAGDAERAAKSLKSKLGPFASRDIERQVEKNWAALAKIYGDTETARVAVLQNRQVVSPVYADPALLQRTRDILVEKLGREEAMQVMQDNPAVLTCGEPLANETPADIVSTAKLRKVLDATLKPDVVAVIVVLAVGGVIARLAAAAY